MVNPGGHDNADDVIRQLRAVELPRVDEFEPAHLAAMREARMLADSTGTTGETDMKSLLSRRSVRVLLVAGAALVATTSMAFAGALPDSMQDTIADAADPIGVDLPGGSDEDEAVEDESANEADDATEEADEVEAPEVEPSDDSQSNDDSNGDSTDDDGRETEDEDESRENEDSDDSVDEYEAPEHEEPEYEAPDEPEYEAPEAEEVEKPEPAEDEDNSGSDDE